MTARPESARHPRRPTTANGSRCRRTRSPTGWTTGSRTPTRESKTCRRIWRTGWPWSSWCNVSFPVKNFPGELQWIHAPLWPTHIVHVLLAKHVRRRIHNTSICSSYVVKPQFSAESSALTARVCMCVMTQAHQESENGRAEKGEPIHRVRVHAQDGENTSR